MPLELRRRARAQAPLLTVLAIVLGVFIYLTIAPDHWRRGTALIAIAMLLAGVMRLVLARQQAGMLAVRGRWWDSFCYLALGAAILIIDIRLRN
jgi:inner membrane protein involved in colicin E2 resistance